MNRGCLYTNCQCKGNQILRKLLIKRFLTELNETNMYLVVDRGSDHAVLIDPSDAAVIRRYAPGGSHFQEAQIDYIALTHEHYDHIAALNEARKLLPGCKVIASKKCSDRIQDPRKNMSKYFDIILDFKEGYDAEQSRDYHIEPYRADAADMVFESSMRMDWHGYCVTLAEAPGHSPGSTLIDIDRKHLFCGDSLSYDYETLTKLPGGDSKAYAEITKPLLRSFGREAIVYPGHGRVFTLAEA